MCGAVLVGLGVSAISRTSASPMALESSALETIPSRRAPDCWALASVDAKASAAIRKARRREDFIRRLLREGDCFRGGTATTLTHSTRGLFRPRDSIVRTGVRHDSSAHP